MFRLGLFSNPWVLIGAGAMIVLQIAFTYVPLMHVAFGSEPLGLTEWWLILGTGTLIYLVVGIEKWLRRLPRAAESCNVVGDDGR
jgi:Ca2+-transporting ATPase